MNDLSFLEYGGGVRVSLQEHRWCVGDIVAQE